MVAELRRFKWVALALGTLATMAFFHGCGGSSDEGTGGSAGKKDAGNDGKAGDANVNPNCFAAGKTCATSADCCSAFCDPSINACANPTNCKAPGDGCASPTECCTNVCSGGQCGSGTCTADLHSCSNNAECCGGKCGTDPDAGANVCIPLSGCKTAGNPCNGNGDCCSSYCQNGLCSGAPSFCRQTNDSCSNNAECCTGICNIASGALLGTCKQPDAPGTTGCLIAGEVCGGGATGTSDGGIPPCGGECCSRSCAPYGPTGVLVCQPPSGCHPTGEICAKDSDCCGSAGLPGGNGSVTCSKSAGEATGRCDNGNACRPSGAVCKLATTSCNAENNCCAGNVNQDPSVCQQDLLGIPRCTGVGDCGDAGSKAGQACASSADCCGLPCVPDPSGTGYVCGNATCVPAGGTCSTSADCCAGLPCVVPSGSTQGICGYTPPPDAGIPDAAIPDSGIGCALYGQICTTAADCCNGVPCNGGRCVFITK